MNVTSIPAIRPLFTKISELTSNWSTPWSSGSFRSKERLIEKRYPGPRIQYTPDTMSKNSTSSDKPMITRVPAKAPKVHTGFTQNMNSQYMDTDRDVEYGFDAVLAKHKSNGN